MYEWIVDGISSLFVPFSGGKSRSWPRNGGPSETAPTPDEQRQENCSNRPAKRNYESVHSPEGTSEPVEVKRPKRDVILSTVKKTLAGVAGFLRLQHPKPNLQHDKRVHKRSPLQPVVLAGIDEIPSSNFSMRILNGNVKMDKLREGGSAGQDKTPSAFSHNPLSLTRKQDSGPMVFRGAQNRTLRQSLQLLPARPAMPVGLAAPDPALASHPHKPCLAVEEALKESDREQYLRLVEMVSEKYSKSRPLPFAQMKPLTTPLPVDGQEQTVFGKAWDKSKPKLGPLRANPRESVWRDVSSGKQPKDRSADGNLSKPVGDLKTTRADEQLAWKPKPVDVDLSAEVAARLNLKDREPSLPSSTPALAQSRAASQPDSRQAEEELPRLTKEMQQEVAAALAQRDASLVLSSAFKLHITQRDLVTLQEGSWLNDEVINFYLNLVMSRSQEQQVSGGRRVYSFSTFFFPKLHGGGHPAVRRWTKALDLFTFDLILVPLHLGVHWSLAVVDFRTKSVKSYDSMGQRHDDICHLILRYLKEEMNAKKGKDLDVTKWTVSSLKASEIPQQKNGSDCGVFACKYADYISRGRPLTFRQCHMPLFRKLMIWEILNQRLL
ncbi:hypothetical protein ACEWY4_016973 [Coilia grayii]|uniref:Ubiquitin-like protease family profile domain-containing protein n=1 Tax=Coilia grayii TaxID=363190 RepID=A0ABD1JLW4_9TELE